ncbi:hypothetical protein AN618_07650 [Fervidicola ferrireducens]|uniref:ATP synthase I chain n=1 Tax=Fervidicola ferrireducens TaxID=520764 RepID=A0A140LBN2_9FIRM|nr:hypothetical protein AN618_07650 [Fervidicola ferrireducens]
MDRARNTFLEITKKSLVLTMVVTLFLLFLEKDGLLARGFILGASLSNLKFLLIYRELTGLASRTQKEAVLIAVKGFLLRFFVTCIFLIFALICDEKFFIASATGLMVIKIAILSNTIRWRQKRWSSSRG